MGHRVRFAKINVDDARRIADSYRVSSIPAVVLFDRGRPVARSIRVKPAARLAKELGLGMSLISTASRRHLPCLAGPGQQFAPEVRSTVAVGS